MKKTFQHIDKNNNTNYKLTFGVYNIFVFALNKNIKLNLLIAIFGNLTNQNFFLLIIYKKFATSALQAILLIKSTIPVTIWRR